MKRMLAFSSRCAKDIIRDPLTLCFGLGFPLVILLLLWGIQQNIPVEMFMLDELTPGIAVFGLSFIALFSGMLLARDRTSSFLTRLFSSPLTAADFICGYTLPLLPMSVLQALICYGAALVLGLEFTFNIFLAVLVLIPAMILFIAIGLLCGSLLNDKQVGGICGALLTNLSAWLSGTWFSLDIVGNGFKSVAKALPFCHAVDAGRAALAGDYAAIMPELWWVVGYAAVISAAAVFVFRRKMRA